MTRFMCSLLFTFLSSMKSRINIIFRTEPRLHIKRSKLLSDRNVLINNKLYLYTSESSRLMSFLVTVRPRRPSYFLGTVVLFRELVIPGKKY